MRIPRRREEEEGLPLTPLIDVVFLLLIFFLTATSFHQKEKDIRVTPPKATEGRTEARRPREITVNIRSERDGGFLVVEGRIFTLDRLQGLLAQAAKDNPRTVCLIRGDRHAYHQRVVDVLNACKKANIAEYHIVTIHQQAK